MNIIDYNDFLSKRFDLVIRWYILEGSDFDIYLARQNAMSSKYNHIKNASQKLLEKDIKIHRIMAKIKSQRVSKLNYGSHVMKQLFTIKHLEWIEQQMIDGEDWIKEDPYPLTVTGVGIASKRFILALKHDKHLYWFFRTRDKVVLDIWKEENYKELLNFDEWNDLKNFKIKMVEKMNDLNFFSIDTYGKDYDDDCIKFKIKNRR